MDEESKVNKKDGSNGNNPRRSKDRNGKDQTQQKIQMLWKHDKQKWLL